MALKDFRRKLVRVEPGAKDGSPVSTGAYIPEGQAEQLDFPANSAVGVMEPVTNPATQKREVQTGEINLSAITVPLAQKSAPTVSRDPVLIPSTGKKSKSIRPPQGRRMVVQVAVSFMLFVVVFFALAAVLPVDTQGKSTLFGVFNPLSKMVPIKQNDAALIASQAATATAVTQGGYEYNGAGAGYQFAGVNTNITPEALPNTDVKPSGGYGNEAYSNHFTAGQCTFWAAYRYHQLRGYNLPWSGNAMDWPFNAPAYSGWHVVATPIVGSIIAIQPGYQYAGPYGHVAIVEGINADGSLRTSNYNVKGWGVYSVETYHAGPGVSFIYHE